MIINAKMRKLLDELCLGNVEQIENLPGIGANIVAKMIDMGLVEKTICPMSGKIGIGLTPQGMAADAALRKV